jgi:hypothetical protein
MSAALAGGDLVVDPVSPPPGRKRVPDPAPDRTGGIATAASALLCSRCRHRASRSPAPQAPASRMPNTAA